MIYHPITEHFNGCLHLIYPSKIVIINTTESKRSASYVDLFLDIETDGRLQTRATTKGDDFKCPCSIVKNTPHFTALTYPLINCIAFYISKATHYSYQFTCSHNTYFISNPYTKL